MGLSGIPHESEAENLGKPEGRRAYGALTAVLDAANAFLNQPDPTWDDYFKIEHQINHLTKDLKLTETQKGYLQDLSGELFIYISTVEDYQPYNAQPILQQIRDKGREYIYFLSHPV
jgi:hypothetical protein